MNDYQANYAGLIQIVLVEEEVDASGASASNTNIYRCRQTQVVQFAHNNAPSDRTILCKALNDAPLVIGRYYIAYQPARKCYFIDNQSIFLEVPNA